MQSLTASAVTASVVPLTPPSDTRLPRYTIGITTRQEFAILTECNRRGIGLSEMARRIFDGWTERWFDTLKTKADGGDGDAARLMQRFEAGQ